MDVWHISYWEMTLRIVSAVFLGGLVGLEREWNNHAAGFRTHILVCIGSTTIMLLSMYGFSDFVDQTNVRIDPARLAAQVISGIGFLGAGSIIRNGSSVTGLTTAASLWVMAAVGLSIGAGFYFVAAVSTFVVLISLYILNKWEKRLLHTKRKQKTEMKVLGRIGCVGSIVQYFEDNGVTVSEISVENRVNTDLDEKDEVKLQIRFILKFMDKALMIRVLDNIYENKSVISIESNLLIK